MIWNSKLAKRINTDIKLSFPYPSPFSIKFLASFRLCICIHNLLQLGNKWHNLTWLKTKYTNYPLVSVGRTPELKAEFSIQGLTKLKWREQPGLQSHLELWEVFETHSELGSLKPIQNLGSFFSAACCLRVAHGSRGFPQVLAAWVPPNAVHNMAVFFLPGQQESIVWTNLIHTKGQEQIRGIYPRRTKHWEQS